VEKLAGGSNDGSKGGFFSLKIQKEREGFIVGKRERVQKKKIKGKPRWEPVGNTPITELTKVMKEAKAKKRGPGEENNSRNNAISI